MMYGQITQTNCYFFFPARDIRYRQAASWSASDRLSLDPLRFITEIIRLDVFTGILGCGR
jgi:hypothetical protein